MSRRPIGSIRWIADGIAKVEVKHGTDPTTGKPRRLTETVHGTQRDAEIVKARLLLEIGKTPPTSITLGQFLDGMYLPDARTRLRARTVRGYESIYKTHVIPKIGTIPLAHLGGYQLARWFQDVDGAKRTRVHVYRALCTALNKAVEWGQIPYNPMRSVTPPTIRIERPDVLTKEEAGAYLEKFSGHVLEPLIVIALAAGLRRSELAGLRWTDIDFERRTVTIVRGHHDVGPDVLEELPKSVTSARTISLPAWAIERLRPYRGIGALVTEGGSPIRPWRISRLYDAHVASSGLRRIQLKNLRHTHACLLLDAGVPIYTVAKRLGHESVAVTERYYLRPNDEADRAAADLLDLGGEQRPAANSGEIVGVNA